MTGGSGEIPDRAAATRCPSGRSSSRRTHPTTSRAGQPVLPGLEHVETREELAEDLTLRGSVERTCPLEIVAGDLEAPGQELVTPDRHRSCLAGFRHGRAMGRRVETAGAGQHHLLPGLDRLPHRDMHGHHRGACQLRRLTRSCQKLPGPENGEGADDGPIDHTPSHALAPERIHRVDACDDQQRSQRHNQTHVAQRVVWQLVHTGLEVLHPFIGVSRQ